MKHSDSKESVRIKVYCCASKALQRWPLWDGTRVAWHSLFTDGMQQACPLIPYTEQRTAWVEVCLWRLLWIALTHHPHAASRDLPISEAVASHFAPFATSRTRQIVDAKMSWNEDTYRAVLKFQIKEYCNCWRIFAPPSLCCYCGITVSLVFFSCFHENWMFFYSGVMQLPPLLVLLSRWWPLVVHWRK